MKRPNNHEFIGNLCNGIGYDRKCSHLTGHPLMPVFIIESILFYSNAVLEAPESGDENTWIAQETWRSLAEFSLDAIDARNQRLVQDEETESESDAEE
jgi:hypothetical protein